MSRTLLGRERTRARRAVAAPAAILTGRMLPGRRFAEELARTRGAGLEALISTPASP
jgi:hypothetical protein